MKFVMFMALPVPVKFPFAKDIDTDESAVPVTEKLPVCAVLPTVLEVPEMVISLERPNVIVSAFSSTRIVPKFIGVTSEITN